MKRKRVFLLFLGLFLVGCGEGGITHMKTKDVVIDHNRYIDYRYGFEITLPTNWVFGRKKKHVRGYKCLFTFNIKLGKKLTEIGEIMLYYVYQEGGESPQELFNEKYQYLLENIEIDKSALEDFAEEKDIVLPILEQVINTNRFILTNGDQRYEWYYLEEISDVVTKKNGEIKKIESMKLYWYSYYIPYISRRGHYYHIPVGIIFDDWPIRQEILSEEEYLRLQREVIQSFKTFSNFVRDGFSGNLKFVL